MIHRLSTAALLLIAAGAAGCATMGAGSGSTANGAHPVTFTWKSSDDVSGSITAALADGKTYTGRYFQVTRDTDVSGLGPLWAGWGPGRRMGGWYDWDPGPQFITHYSGRVVANLTASGGGHVRCRFLLVHPDEGMVGGGQGECQLPGGQRIDAQFPTAWGLNLVRNGRDADSEAAAP
ncbi:MAG TPA: hypothetical protein VHV80_15365 [Steroidobacteraceae bacterium]|jgi:hypothetical protein|nr:hypothetical protein [Steroidobacteraceae bacterium]